MSNHTDGKNPSDLSSGVTQQDLKATERTLRKFKATAIDEWNECPQWILTALYAVQRIQDESRWCVFDESPTPVEQAREYAKDRGVLKDFRVNNREMLKEGGFIDPEEETEEPNE